MSDALRRRFEGAMRSDGYDAEMYLRRDPGRPTDYYDELTQHRWEGFERGYAAAIDDAATVCDEWATQFEPSSMAPTIDHYSARLLQRLSKAIRALLARESAAAVRSDREKQ